MTDCEHTQVEVVLFYADARAENPLWKTTDGRPYRVDELPLSTELRSELEQWAHEAASPYNTLRPGHREALRSIGQQLCSRTAEELGPSYEVRWSSDV